MTLDGETEGIWPGRLDLVDVTLSTSEENLALDEALLLEVESRKRGPTLRLWEWPDPVVIVGRSSQVADEVEVAACRRDGVPILRRCTGGCAVLLGAGCLNFTLALAVRPERHFAGISAAIEIILERVVSALRPVVPDVELCGTSDLAVHGRKVSGNSQRWMKGAFLHHGTLLYDFPVDRVSRYLTLPGRQPDYRQGRDHAAFLTNLPISAGELRRCLIDVWGAECGETGELPIPHDVVARLVREKYGSEAWTLRR